MIALSAFLLTWSTVVCAQTTEQANFYRALYDHRQADQMLPNFLRRLAEEKLQERRRRLGSVRDWSEYRSRFRRALLESIGGLPERTPLNARVVGRLERDGYRIEKVIFESRPRFYVTANLYLPASGSPPFPAILFPLGHELGAKAHAAWQIVLGNLARRGFVLLAWDPIGQGERIQIRDEDFQDSKLFASTTEHTMMGVQSILLGDALAQYTIWDGMRALDYLLSRPEVDAGRVGITGNSGGGTHSAYLAALDDRIHVAAPSCYLTNWSRLLATIGPQDAEQCFPGWLAAGYDHADFILAFAPKPYLMLVAVRDFFSIDGARATYDEAARIYASIGAQEKIAKVEADDGHGYSRPRREAAYRWFTRWLKGQEDTTAEHEIRLASEAELNCTPTGQVLTALGGESVHSLQQARLKQIRGTGSLEDVRRLTQFTVRKAPLRVDAYGEIELDNLRVEKLAYVTEPGIQVPALLYLPVGSGRRAATVLVHGRGKAAAAELARKLASGGEIVLAIDARGFGETAASSTQQRTDWQRYFGDYDSAMTALLLGRPLVGMRAEDISAAAGLLLAREDVDPVRLSVYGVEAGAVAALYAAALDSRIRAATLEGLLVSYERVIERRIHRRVLEHVVHGALRYWDLPDLVRWMAPRQVRILSRLDPLGRPLP